MESVGKKAKIMPAGFRRLDIIYLLGILGWIDVCISGQVKTTSQNSWMEQVSLGGSLTLSLLFLRDQAHTVLFAHKTPPAIAFVVMLSILSVRLVWKNRLRQGRASSSFYILRFCI